MAGFPTSCAQMLLFLQLSVLVFSHSVQNHRCRGLKMFHTDVETLKKAVEDCSGNCSTTTVERKCQCLNLTMSPEDSALHGFFIKGVRALNSTLPGSSDCTRIIRKLENLVHCQIDRIPLLQRERPLFRSVTIISPKEFVGKLLGLSEELNTMLNEKSS